MKKQNALAFFHMDGFIPSWNFAKTYAGKNGHIATMEDIISARLDTEPGSFIWERWCSTNSAEYLGLSRKGIRLIIVAHGVGPLSTIEGIKEAYSYEYKDKEKNRRGGRIDRQDFLNLESGKYGDVHCIPLDDYLRMYEYPFISPLTQEQALNDPLLRARLGIAAEAYINHHAKAARKWHLEEGHGHVANPIILSCKDESNLTYFGYSNDCGKAYAHILGAARLCNTHFSGKYYPKHPSLHCEIDIQGWSSAGRFVGIPEQYTGEIVEGPDADEITKSHHEKLYLDVSETVYLGLTPIMQCGDQWFTMYPKKGARHDTYEPEFRVTSCEDIGGEVKFSTEDLFFFRYDIKEIKPLVPQGANAYKILSDFVTREGGETKSVMVQFCKVEIDGSRRLMRSKDLLKNYTLLMELHNKQTA